MRAVVTRVSSASVTIDGAVRGAIEKGYLVLLGVGPQDTDCLLYTSPSPRDTR